MEPIRHVRPALPLRFPESQPEWDLGQSIRHLHLCAILYEILTSAVGPSDSVGSDQFVYFDAANPRRCLAPDGFVKLGVAQEMFETWRVWERGAPELAIEVLSPSDTREPLSLPEKVERYASVGVRELIAFDVDAPEGERLRAWDRVDDELVSRVVEGERTPCLTLGGTFVLAPANDQPVALRLARDPNGTDLFPTHLERSILARADADRARADADRAQADADRAQADADRAQAELRSAQADAERAQAALESTRAERDAARAELERLRAELRRR
jgi:Putative restriction endonuclease